MDNGMINKSNSFQTMLSYDMSLDNEISEFDAVVNDDLEYHVVLDTTGSDSSFLFEDKDDEGIMIVSPKSSHEASRKSEFSLPDSVPSDMGDIPNPILIPDLLGEANPDEDDEDLLRSFHEHNDSFAPKPKTTSTHVQGNRVRLALFAGAVLLAASYLVVEHSALSKKARHLKELEEVYLHNLDVISFAKEREELNHQLEEQVRVLQDEAVAREKVQAAKEAYWRSQSSAGSSFPFGDEPPLMDNCWVHARAKMEFGECTKEATKTVKEQVSSWGKSIDKTRGRIWDQVQRDFRDAKAFYYQQQQQSKRERETTKKGATTPPLSWADSSLGKTWSKMQHDYQDMMAWYTEPPRDGGIPQDAKPRTTVGADATAAAGKTSKNGVDLKDTARSFVASVALGTAAAVVLSAVDWFVKKDDQDKTI